MFIIMGIKIWNIIWNKNKVKIFFKKDLTNHCKAVGTCSK